MQLCLRQRIVFVFVTIFMSKSAKGDLILSSQKISKCDQSNVCSVRCDAKVKFWFATKDFEESLFPSISSVVINYKL